MAEIATGLRDDVTVVLLGHEQPDHRGRAIHYYQQLGVPCLALEHVADSSCNERLNVVLERVTTPFVVLVGDADFLLLPALATAVNRLQEQPDVIAAQGYSLAYRPGNREVAYHKCGSAITQELQEGAIARLKQYAIAGQQAWRAVMRVPVLNALLRDLPDDLEFATWRTALSWALLAQGPIAHLAQTDVVCEYANSTLSPVARAERLASAVRVLRQWDSERQALCADDLGFAVLSHFVRMTYDHGEAPLLFTSRWNSVKDEPPRQFEPTQFVELPYYNGELFTQLSTLEFLWHAWPTGQAHRHALEGTWVRQRELLIVHPNDTAESLQERYWKAQALSLFNPQVCQRLLSTLTGADDQQLAQELSDWQARLQQFPGIDPAVWLSAMPSGQVLDAIAAATPDAVAQQTVLAHLAKRPASQVAFVVLDLDNDDHALQATFDSLLASGLRNFKLVVLKAGKPPAITTPRDTLHFVQVTAGNWVSHVNQVVRQLPSEWLMLLQAGDVLTTGGLMRLQVELAEAPACLAICANEVQRDADGRLLSVVRPGGNLDLLRSRPDLMSRHWLVRRQTVLDVGGYSEAHRHALEFDLLLRLVEQNGLGCLAHMDEYLVIGQQASTSMNADALSTLNRHLAQLGYRGQVSDQGEGGLLIDFRHSSTPLVSVLLGAEGDLTQLQSCLTSVFQRTRYPRFEVLVACAGDKAEACATVLNAFGPRVRLLAGDARDSRNELLNLAASQAHGEYLILLSERCQVLTPAWIEGLLNQGQRPEVGVVGARLLSHNGNISHAGFDLLCGPRVHAPWTALSFEEASSVWCAAAVRSCVAVSGDCLMVRKAVFDHCGGLQPIAGADIDLCQRAAEAGQLVIWTPQAQLLDNAVPMPNADQCQGLQLLWPAAFGSRMVVDDRSGVDMSRTGVTPELEWLAALS